MNVIDKQTHLKKLIEYEKEVREDRRMQFEEWDKNSAALIEQYKKELAKIEAGE